MSTMLPTMPSSAPSVSKLYELDEEFDEDGLPYPTPDLSLFDGRGLPETDGVPMESEWHVLAPIVLMDSLRFRLRPREDFYTGANMCMYYSRQQIRNREFVGPDFFYVDGVPLHPVRKFWRVWEEGGRYPDVIIELLSRKTARRDRGPKKRLYEKTFQTPEYYCCDPKTMTVEGWRLKAGHGYEPITPDERGWLWCEQLQLWIGTWTGEIIRHHNTWCRFFTPDGQVVPLESEYERAQAESAKAQAEAAKAQAEAAKAELQSAQAQVAAERVRADALEQELALLRQSRAAPSS